VKKDLKMKQKINPLNISAREIIEYYVLNQKDFIDNRDFKYYLGDVLSKKILNQSDLNFNLEQLKK
jgi:hypothetical protein